MQNDHEIMGQLERLAASFPWDEVELTLRRRPTGEIRATAYMPANDQFGFSYLMGHGDTVAEAVDRAIAEGVRYPRDPALAKEKKLDELREQVTKLEAVRIGEPPYVPNRELAQYVQSAVEIHATAEAQPLMEGA